MSAFIFLNSVDHSVFNSVTEQVFEMSLARPGPNGSQMIHVRFNEFLIIKYLA